MEPSAFRYWLKPWLTESYPGLRVHYKKKLAGGGQTFGQDYLRFFRDCRLPTQGRVFEWCAGPAFIGFSLLAHGLCETLCLADVNPRAVHACRRTIRKNRLKSRVTAYQSDNLDAIPADERWNLVVSNPPHFADHYRGSLRAHDPDWAIHRGFYAGVGRFLAPEGLILIQENGDGSGPETFREMIEAGGLRIVYGADKARAGSGTPPFYFLGSMRAGAQRPCWLPDGA
jgi:hypothetical protein